MRKIASLLIVMTLMPALAHSQVQTPRPSPGATVKQTVGLTDFEIEYSRPGMKGRKIFGDLVPYGKLWRTGANKATQFTVSTDIKVEGKDLPKGHYALYTVPNESNWDIIFYAETEIWGTPQKWVDSLEVLRINVKSTVINDPVESFTISMDDVSDGNSAVLSFAWEKTRVSVKIEVPTEKISMASIDKTLAGPDANDYYRAASYYHENGKDLKMALEWIKKAVAMSEEPPYWMLRREALIEADSGDKKAAIETAKKSLEAAKKAKNDDYIRMNEKSIEEWSK